MALEEAIATEQVVEGEDGKLYYNEQYEGEEAGEHDDTQVIKNHL
jgi:hypothetical protein